MIFLFITSYCISSLIFFFFFSSKRYESTAFHQAYLYIFIFFYFSFFSLSTPDTENWWYQSVVCVEEGLWHGDLSPAVFFWCCMRVSVMWCCTASWAGEEEGSALLQEKCLYLRECEPVANSWRDGMPQKSLVRLEMWQLANNVSVQLQG